MRPRETEKNTQKITIKITTKHKNKRKASLMHQSEIDIFKIRPSEYEITRKTKDLSMFREKIKIWMG